MTYPKSAVKGDKSEKSEIKFSDNPRNINLLGLAMFPTLTATFWNSGLGGAAGFN